MKRNRNDIKNKKETDVSQMLTIGITGGIGSGKTAVTRILEEYGAKIILADEIAKEVVEPQMPAYASIVYHFGAGILDEKGWIDRKKLGEIVFSDQRQLNNLNQFTHSAVAKQIEELLEEERKKGTLLVVVEAIVPIEHGFLDLVDRVWVVLASQTNRIERIVKRDGLTLQQARQRIYAQMSDAQYKAIADTILYNDGTVEELRKKVWEVIQHEKDSQT